MWLTTDHLCSVWCLQQVIAINRFLYSIIAPFKSRNQISQGQSFIEEKSIRLQKARQQFSEKRFLYKNNEVTLIKEDIGNWVEDSRRVFKETFKSGLNETRYQMIRLVSTQQNKVNIFFFFVN